MSGYHPFLLFFNTPHRQEEGITESFDRKIMEFFALHKEDLSFLKSHTPEQLFELPQKPHHAVIGHGTHITDKTLFGVRSWQPSYQFTPLRIRFQILRFDQTIWPSRVLENEATRQRYVDSLSLFCESIVQLRPSVCVHMHEHTGKPWYIMFDTPDSLLAFMAYNDHHERWNLKQHAKQVTRVCLRAISSVQERFPEELVRKPTGFVMNCMQKNVYHELCKEITQLIQSSEPSLHETSSHA